MTFCGSEIFVEKELGGNDGKFCFRQFESGEINIHNLRSKHPNVFKSVIIGKKSWGLNLEQWSNGINEWCFTKEDILNEFEKNNIKIPKPLLKEFNNIIERKRLKRIEEEILRLSKK